MITFPKESQYSYVKRDVNILTLVGNGFDLQVMKHFGSPLTTSYVDFYKFASLESTEGSTLILSRMADLRTSNPEVEDWSDVEAAIGRLHEEGHPISKIRSSLKEVQEQFSEFLAQAVNPPLLTKLSEESSENRWAIHSLSHFLEDIKTRGEMEKIDFSGFGEHYLRYNHIFVNFNYAGLLDDYIHLDESQFDPRPHAIADRNFEFNSDPRGLVTGVTGDNVQSSYLSFDITHPHGNQSTPRSLLFGTGNITKPNDVASRLSKYFWAQYDERYKQLLSEARLFVIFGCSIGATDAWWWKSITTHLLEDASKILILYVFVGSARSEAAEQMALESFLDHSSDLTAPQRSRIGDQVITVPFSSSTDHTFLGMGAGCDTYRTDPRYTFD